jgi:hypothetical protein
VGLAANVAQAQILYSENFDSLTLMDSVNERLGPGPVTRVATDAESAPYPMAFTHVGPTGWEVDNTLGQYDGVVHPSFSPSPVVGGPTYVGVPGVGVADYGVDEWEGWSFANKDFWATVAGDQNRTQFTSGSGVVAVADPDEYFDMPSGDVDNATYGGYYNSSLKSPSLSVLAGDFYELKYDSSWRDESFDDDFGQDAGLNAMNNQLVEVLAVFDSGETYVINGWDSADPANASNPATPAEFKNDAPNETGLTGSFFVPAGASAVRFHFNIANAANDWWWAVDNLKMNHYTLDGMGDPVVVEEWAEDFESVTLGDSVNEREAFTAHQTVADGTLETQPRPESFTNIPPAGWNIDNSGMPAGALGKDDIGVYEFEGWTFAPLSFWLFADGQRRNEFTKCVGNCAIADSDEWTDLADSSNFGAMDTLLESPSIDVSSAIPGGLRLSFDSSWRDEDEQTAVVEISYDDGATWQEVLRWESNQFLDPEETMPNPNFHDDNTNESVLLAIDNPLASTARLRFSHLGGNNNWWWAIDNIQVSAVPEPGGCFLAIAAISAIGCASRNRRRS